MPTMLTLKSVLSNPLVGGLAVISAVALAIALLVTGVKLHLANGTIARQERSIAQLQGAIIIQNAQVEAWKATGDAASKEAQERKRAADAAKKKADAVIAELLSRPVPTDPGEACTKADALILEFAK